MKTLIAQAHDWRALTLPIEKSVRGVYNTAFYPTYDYLTVWEQTFKKQQQ